MTDPTGGLPERLLPYFGYDHLPPELQAYSKPVADLAVAMVALLPAGLERTVGLRKLIEAKDWFVRAALDAQQRKDDTGPLGPE